MEYCPHCMAPNVSGPFCPKCGGDLTWKGQQGLDLPVGTILAGASGLRDYWIGASLGKGGFGNTYIAIETTSHRKVAIKEYFPSRYVFRGGDGTTVQTFTGQEQSFQAGLTSFLREAKMLLSQEDLPSVVQVIEFFQANNTAYLVMEYLDGLPLHGYMKKIGGPIPPQDLLEKLDPVIRDLSTLHGRGVLHRDISPDNLMWMPNGTIKVMDFGSARSMEDGKSMTTLMKEGFSPIEQYRSKGQGPYSDIYALAATIYYCLTGILPPGAVDRLDHDTLQPPTQLGVGITPEQENAILWGLSIQPQARPQTMEAFHNALYRTQAAGPFQSPTLPADQPYVPSSQTPPSGGPYQAPPASGGGYQAPPASGGGYQAPPAYGGPYQAPPASSGGYLPYGGPYQAPPASGGGYQAPPPSGGGYQAPPPSGGGYQTPPASGGGYQTPPASSGGYQTPPPSGGGYQTPPPSGGPYQAPPASGPVYRPQQPPTAYPPKKKPPVVPIVIGVAAAIVIVVLAISVLGGGKNPATLDTAPPSSAAQTPAPGEGTPSDPDAPYRFETLDGSYYYRVEDNCAVITKYNGGGEQFLAIPDVIDGYPVAEIADNAFEGATCITVQLPHNLQRIGSQIFRNCKFLTFIYAYSNVTMAKDAFQDSGAKDILLEDKAMPTSWSSAGSFRIFSVGQQTPVGKITGFQISFGNDLYAITDQDQGILLDLMDTASDITIMTDILDESGSWLPVTWIDDYALNRLTEKSTIHIPDNCLFSATSHILDNANLDAYPGSPADNWILSVWFAQGVNAAREAGAPAIAPNADAAEAAAIRASELFTLNDWARPNGQDSYTVMQELGVPYSFGNDIRSDPNETPEEMMSFVVEHVAPVIADGGQFDGQYFTQLGAGRCTGTDSSGNPLTYVYIFIFAQ